MQIYEQVNHICKLNNKNVIHILFRHVNTEGDVLRIEVKKSGKTQEEFASEMGFSRNYLLRLMERAELPEDIRLNAAKILKKSVHEIFGSVQNANSRKENGGTPVYDIDATAGGNLDFSNQLPETIKGYINLPNFKKCIAFITVRGDSMYPKFRAGDLIGIEPLEDMDIIQWGQVYVVLTMDNQRVLKYVRKGKDENHFILKSENPNYDDMLLNKNKVRKLFMAKGPVRDDWQ